jgi:hypothetical protein
LGDWEDIEHKTLTSLESDIKDNPAYGKAKRFLKRPTQTPTVPDAGSPPG